MSVACPVLHQNRRWLWVPAFALGHAHISKTDSNTETWTTLGFGSAFTSVLKRLLIRLAFFIRPATDQKMCACPSANAGTHTPCSVVLGAVAETFSLIEHRWL